MTTTDKTVLAVVILCVIGIAASQYWQMLEPIRLIAATLSK